MIHKYVLVIVALTFLVPGTVFAADAQQSDDSTEATNSVKIFINGQQVEGRSRRATWSMKAAEPMVNATTPPSESRRVVTSEE